MGGVIFHMYGGRAGSVHFAGYEYSCKWLRENAWNLQNTFIFGDYEANKVSPLIEKLASYFWSKTNAISVISFILAARMDAP